MRYDDYKSILHARFDLSRRYFRPFPTRHAICKNLLELHLDQNNFQATTSTWADPVDVIDRAEPRHKSFLQNNF